MASMFATTYRSHVIDYFILSQPQILSTISRSAFSIASHRTASWGQFRSFSATFSHGFNTLFLLLRLYNKPWWMFGQSVTFERSIYFVTLSVCLLCSVIIWTSSSRHVQHFCRTSFSAQHLNTIFHCSFLLTLPWWWSILIEIRFDIQSIDRPTASILVHGNIVHLLMEIDNRMKTFPHF